MNSRCLSVGTAVVAIAAIAGCQSKTEAAEARARNRPRPAHVRIANLSSRPVEVSVGKSIRFNRVEPFSMSFARPTSPDKPTAVVAAGDGSPESGSITPATQKFVTVIVGQGKGIKSLISGTSVAPANGSPQIELLNLTSHTVTFTCLAKSYAVAPSTSVMLSTVDGNIEVGMIGAASAKFTVGKSQIWTAYALDVKGKTILKVESMKGNGGTAGSGASSAG